MSKLAVVFSFVAGLGTAGSAVFALLQLQHSQNEERPWVGALAADLDVLTPGKPIKARIVYQNVGRTPAVDFSQVSGSKFWTIKDWDNGQAFQILSMWSRFCLASRQIAPSGNVIFPSTSSSYIIEFDTGSDLPAGQKAVVTPQDFFQSPEIFTALECFTYKFRKRLRHTSSCFFYYPGQTSLSALSICAAGNDAD